MKIKLRKTDRLFTQIQRFRFNYTCQKCGRQYDEDGSLYNLGVSHYYGRSREATRYDDDNVTLLCNMPCHRRWGGEERADYTEYMITRLGQKGFEELTIRSNTYKKRDDVQTEAILKEKIKEMEDG
ncbi:hypothetical protein LCGC14_0406460 [marine sediment metagenome]|uniref:Uncharacterized protein n=1 Tax=marine sediment metagenome TaxID=412755 RepID=A0A0F9TDH9_9ZZZZ